MSTDKKAGSFLRRSTQAATDALKMKGIQAIGPEDVEDSVARSAGYASRGSRYPVTGGKSDFVDILRANHIAVSAESDVSRYFRQNRQMEDVVATAISKVRGIFGKNSILAVSIRDPGGAEESCELRLNLAIHTSETDKRIREIRQSVRSLLDRNHGKLTISVDSSHREAP